MALRLAREGAKLGLMARREKDLQALAETIRTLGGVAEVAPCDVADRSQVESAVATLTGKLGPVDLLLASAGVWGRTHGARFVTEDVVRFMEINLMGVIHAFGAVLPSMVARGSGHVAAISSVAGYRGLPKLGAYSASKSAVTILLESLQIDLHKTGVAVSAIHPGYIQTPMTEKSRFPMPFLLTRDEAVDIMIRGLVKRKARIDFPWQMALILGTARTFPNWLWHLLATRFKIAG